MTVLDWAQTISTGVIALCSLVLTVPAILAYLQYRDKNYGLGDGEWDILKGLSDYIFDTRYANLQAYTDYSTFTEKLNEYRDRNAGDIILKGAMHPSSREWYHVRATGLLVGPHHARYCHDLVDRGHLREITRQEHVIDYHLTEKGERLMKQKIKTIRKRFFSCIFINEQEEMSEDVRSWHEFAPGVVKPTFLECRDSNIVGGIEFPPRNNDDNPCDLRCFVIAPATKEEIGPNLGNSVFVKVNSETHHLSEYVTNGLMWTRLVYAKDLKNGYYEMWFGDPVYVYDRGRCLPDFDTQIKESQKKIETTYYPHSRGEAVFPISYKHRRAREKDELETKRGDWLMYRYENHLQRIRRKTRSSWDTLMKKIKRSD